MFVKLHEKVIIMQGRKRERKNDLHIYISKELKTEIQKVMIKLNETSEENITKSDFVRAILLQSIEEINNGNLNGSDIEKTLELYRRLL